MKTFCSDPLNETMIVIYIKNENTMSAIAEVIANAGDGYVQISFCGCMVGSDGRFLFCVCRGEDECRYDKQCNEDGDL